MPVNTPRKEYDDAFPKWERARDCFEGTDAVKGKGVKYLPALDSHQQTLVGIGSNKYEEYLMRALFFNAVGRTVEGLAGALFQTAPNLHAPLMIAPHLEDITLDGTSFEGFGLKIVREILITGRYGVLVDMPSEEVNEPRFFIDQKDRRPYWVGYQAENIISWRTERREGREFLSRVVLEEMVEEEDPKDPYVFNEVKQWRVLELVESNYVQTLWRKVENSDKFVETGRIIPMRRGEPIPFIPFTFFGPTSLSPSVQKPPLDDLVHVNLSHYRTSADLEHGRHFTALPTPWVSGAIAQGSRNQPLAIGSGTAWSLDANGRAGMLEFTGQGLGALEKADEQKRAMMAVLGARMLEDQPSTPETATAVSMRHAGETATLRTIAQTGEGGMSTALRQHVWWMGVETKPSDLPDVSVELNKEFFKTRMAPNELQTLIMALQAETISYETFYMNLARGELTRPGVTAEEEHETIMLETAPLPGEGEFDAEGNPIEPTGGEDEQVVAEGNPYKVVQRGSRFCVVKKEGGALVKCHPSKEKAMAHFKALEANVKE